MNWNKASELNPITKEVGYECKEESYYWSNDCLIYDGYDLGIGAFYKRVKRKEDKTSKKVTETKDEYWVCFSKNSNGDPIIENVKWWCEIVKPE